MKKTSRLLSSLLAVAMLASMSVSSFAANLPVNTGDKTVEDGASGADLSGTGTDVTVNGTVKTPTVKVKLPATMEIWYNPYGLEVDTGISDQVLTTGLKIENLSNTDVAVYAKNIKATLPTTSEKGKEVKLLTKAPTDADVTKSAFLVLRAAVGTDSTAPTDADVSKDLTKITAATATVAGDVVIGTADLKSEVLLAKLEKANGSSATNKGTCVAKIVGAMTKAPTYPWGADDKIDVAATFTVKATTIATK